MRQPTVDKLGNEAERLTDLATEKLDNIEPTALVEWLNSEPTKALILLLESNILTTSLAWRTGSLYRRTIPTYDDHGRVIIPADPEAEQRARHYIEAFENIMLYLEEFEEWRPKEDKEKEE